MMASKKIHYDELKSYVGKTVNSKQLEDILDTFIVLRNVELVNDENGICNIVGTLSTYSKKPIRLHEDNSTLIFHDSIERSEYCNYE